MKKTIGQEGRSSSRARAAAETKRANLPTASAPGDITESKRRAQCLAGIVATAMDAIITIDERHEITLVNLAVEQMFGYSEAELLGKPLSMLIPERYREAHDVHIRNFARTKVTNRGLGRFGQIVGRRANGLEFSVDAAISQSVWAGERLFTVMLRDITQRIEAERALQKNYRLLDRIFATTHFCIIHLDRDFNFVRVNQAYADTCGHPSEFFAGKNHFELYPGEEVEAIFRDVVATGQPFTIYAKPFQFPDHPERGVTYWDWTLHPLRNEDGAIDGLLFALLDVTERTRAMRRQAQLAIIVENSDDAILSCDLDRTILTWNAAAERLFGYAAAEIIGRDALLLVPADQRAEAALKMARLQEGNPVPPYEAVRLAKDGRRVEVSGTLSPIRDLSDKLTGVSLIFRDIGERRRAERERAQLAAIVESSNDAILIRGLDRTILFWNAAAERLFGWSAQEAVGQSIELIRPPERTGTLRGLIEGAARDETSSPVETIHMRKDGARIPTQVTFSPVKDQQGNVVAHSYTVRDMTELKRKEETLRGYARRLRELSRRLREVEESERRAISRELHDRIGQDLSTLGVILGSLGAKLSQESLRAVHKQLQDMQGLLKSMVANVRNVMAELRPLVLDDYGLLAALRQLITEFAQRSGIAAELSGVDLQPRLPSIVETAMFRISQEALNNIAKHAQAKNVEISLYAASDRVVLDIADDGIGFDADETPPDKQHWGMITMRERAEAVGIAFHLESAPGAGTRIVLEAERATT
ncbi:MAG: sensor histidine kinase [Burkholderiales bacterium]